MLQFMGLQSRTQLSDRTELNLELLLSPTIELIFVGCHMKSCLKKQCKYKILGFPDGLADKESPCQ